MKLIRKKQKLIETLEKQYPEDETKINNFNLI